MMDGKNNAHRVTPRYSFCDPQKSYANMKDDCGIALLAIQKCSTDLLSKILCLRT